MTPGALADIWEGFQIRRLARKFGARARSQLNQELFVLQRTGMKRGGFFVEFGATNGVTLNNTYLLETEFDWEGICAEPARQYHAALKANRRARLEFDCVWTTTGEEIEFNEVDDGMLSTIARFNEVDGWAETRLQQGKSFTARTISLLDLLKKHDAPEVIDYLSIDTEGSEYDILRAFDFDAYDIRIITCEHNYTPARQKIFDLLSAKGYRRVLPKLSRWDDWYVRA